MPKRNLLIWAFHNCAIALNYVITCFFFSPLLLGVVFGFCSSSCVLFRFLMCLSCFVWLLERTICYTFLSFVLVFLSLCFCVLISVLNAFCFVISTIHVAAFGYVRIHLCAEQRNDEIQIKLYNVHALNSSGIKMVYFATRNMWNRCSR